MGEFIERLEAIRRATRRTCFLMVHHTPRNSDNLRGSSALEGQATTVLKTIKAGNQVTLETSKQKDIEESKPFDLQLVPAGKSAVLERLGADQQALGPAEMTIVKTLQDFTDAWVAKSVVKTTAGLPEATFYRSVNKLIRKGYVDQQGTRTKMLRYIPDQDRLI